jgi:hydroxyacylglutathione hydrolase
MQAYIIVDKKTGRTAVVDPGDAERVLEHLRELQNQWDKSHDGATVHTENDARSGTAAANSMSLVQSRPELTTALITHYHYDHAGGNKQLHAAIPELRIVGSAKEAIPFANAVATGGAKFWLGTTEIDVIATPCHTRGHVMYHVHGPLAKKSAVVAPIDEVLEASVHVSSVDRGFTGSGALFTGDTLFVGGCGKFFEGTAEQMYAVLYTALRAVPPETPIFCGHEYTVENLKFALWLDRGNKAVEEKVCEVPQRSQYNVMYNVKYSCS